jgi:hypothetical protein
MSLLHSRNIALLGVYRTKTKNKKNAGKIGAFNVNVFGTRSKKVKKKFMKVWR